ncbi:MAG: sodium:calcium antiporter [Candidatus Wildermuthbacteria bacterium]|nr:sodium:calcium antiporter [Candidatus Wildermuthbacteria bacterium]
MSSILFQIAIFLGSIALLVLAARLIIDHIIKVAQYLKWRQFVLAFLVMSLGSALPNLSVGISSALKGVPELSLGNVMGNDVAIFTIVIAIAVLVSNGLSIESRLVRKSALFAVVAALLPILLLWDGRLGRGDAIALIALFILYNLWLFSKRHFIAGIMEGETEGKPRKSPLHGFKSFLKSSGSVAVGVVCLILASEGIVRSAYFFETTFAIPLVIVGVLITGFITALPELYFTTLASRRGNNWIVLGQVLGEVVVLSTLVIGVVALIHPIEIEDFSPLVVARFFLFLSAAFFLLFMGTGKRFSKKEGLILAAIYLAFVATEVFLQR